MRRILPLFALLLFCTAPAAAAEWRVDPDFSKKKARKDISGAVCGPSRCIAINDETHFVQEFSLDERRIIPGDRIDLLDKGEEIDAEAITYLDGAFYVAGSHGLSRKKARFAPEPFTVFWLTGDKLHTSTRLREAIRRAPALAEYAERPLNKNGANIEGMAAHNYRLFFGFRGPSVNGDGYILDVSADALFSDAPLDAKTHEVALGDRIGIRDMAVVDDGILLLSGPVNTLPRRYQIWFWKPGAEKLLS